MIVLDSYYILAVDVRRPAFSFFFVTPLSQWFIGILFSNILCLPFYQGNKGCIKKWKLPIFETIINTHIITTLLFIKIILTVVMTQKQQIKRLMPALTKIISWVGSLPRSPDLGNIIYIITIAIIKWQKDQWQQQQQWWWWWWWCRYDQRSGQWPD